MTDSIRPSWRLSRAVFGVYIITQYQHRLCDAVGAGVWRTKGSTAALRAGISEVTSTVSDSEPAATMHCAAAPRECVRFSAEDALGFRRSECSHLYSAVRTGRFPRCSLHLPTQTEVQTRVSQI